MIDPFIVAIAVFFGGFFGSRFVQESAYKELNNDQKALLVNALSGVRKKVLYIVIGIVALLAASVYLFKEDRQLLMVIYLVALAILMIWTTLVTKNILKENNFPKAYITKYVWGSCLRYFGIGVFLLVLYINGKFTF